MKCPSCGRFMLSEFDGVNVIATCDNPECRPCGKFGYSIIDEIATDKFWEQIDTERIKENPEWLNELSNLAPTVNRKLFV